MIKRSAASAAAMMALAFSAPAYAGDNEGKIQIKAFATGVLPNGEITQVQTNLVGAPAGSDSRTSDSVVPTLAIEYFLSDNISIETICCVTPHDVTGSGPLAGAKLVDDAIILPATVTLKYHFDLGGVKPYIGAGPAHFFIFSEGVGASARTLGATRVDLSNEFGLALQAGMDIPLNDKGLGFSLDAKRYFVGTTARFFAGNTVALQTKHKLDPWVISGGVSYRF
ncbi:MAG: outer membrane beta-barrel protein [Sphingomonadaceae bacterium]|nr:outer membrane beta-barrel protein [Sphingomonadaceae bacterium]